MGLVTLIFDLLTLKLVCGSASRDRIKGGEPFFQMWVLELFAMYATDGRTDGQTDGQTKATLIGPFRTGERIIRDITSSPSADIST